MSYTNDVNAHNLDISAYVPAIVRGVGKSVKVEAFHLQGFDFAGGTISIPVAGTWYVGPDIFSGALILLPRLGHRGWIPVAKVVFDGTTITAIQHIPPIMPKSRLPRSTKKLLDGLTLNVIIIGSSLAESGISDETDWPGMLFASSAKVSNYKIPGTVSAVDYALGGTPNEYQLAQLGYTAYAATIDYDQGGPPAQIQTAWPNGRGSMWSGVDLVIVTTLANGGDYRLQKIEPIIRQLRKMDIEVILTTDDPQGAAQVGGVGPYVWPDYNTVTNAALYVDGPECIRIADLYNIELADTAAFVVDAVFRYPTANIYRDSIHMYYGAPNGRTGQPAGGYEVWARAIRSVINIDATAYSTSVSNYTFPSDIQGWGNYTAGVTTWDALTQAGKCTKNGSASAQWGAASPSIPPIKNGDTVVVTGTITVVGGGYAGPVNIGLQGGGAGWGSNSGAVTTGTPFTATLTAIRDIPSGGYVLLFANADSAPDQAFFEFDNITITVNSSYVSSAFLKNPQRENDAQRLAPIRQVVDMKTPSDAMVILPFMEAHYTIVDAYRGTLNSSPLGASSFARRMCSAVASNQDLLTVTTGQRCCISVAGAVGISMIYYSTANDAGFTFDLYKNGSLIQSGITSGAQTISREILMPIITPTQYAVSTPTPDVRTWDLRVTAGNMRVAALIGLTSDMSWYGMEQVSTVGTFTKVSGPSLRSWATDTSQDYVYFRAPETGKGRVYFINAGKPYTTNVNHWSGRTRTANAQANGQNHVFAQGGNIGPGEIHFIQLASAQGNTGQSTNGYGMQVGGVCVVNDR